MIKLFRYLRRYGLWILFATALLFFQANIDLALPDYMSRIVNVGLQQHGIEDSVPRVIPEAFMKQLSALLEEKDFVALNEYYKEFKENDAQVQAVYKDFPGLKGSGVFVLKEGSETAEAIDLWAQIFLKVAALSQGSSVPNLDTIDSGIRKQIVSGGISQFYERLGFDLSGAQVSYIVKTGGLMLILTLLGALATIMVGYIASRTGAGFARTLRKEVFSKVESFSSAEFDHFSTASLITRTTNDINQIQMLTIFMIRMVVYAPIMGIGGVIRAVSKAPSMAWLIGVAVLALIGVIIVVMAVAMPKFRIIQKLVDKLNLVARENLSGLMVVRAFNREKVEEDRFDSANKELTRVNLFVNRVMVLMLPLVMFIMNLLSVVIIWVGAHQIAEATMQVGDMMAFLQYAMQIIMSFMMFRKNLPFGIPNKP